MDKSILERVQKITELSLILNSDKTERDITGDKPTVFYYFFGNVCAFDVEICEDGWSNKPPYDEASKSWKISLNSTEAESQLDEVIEELIKLIEEWGN